MQIKCPICNNELVKIEKTCRCINNHSYDMAKEGYFNLLKKQGGKDFGDSKDMVKARRDFFDLDYYGPLKIRLTEIIKSLNIKTALDLGCGEGYYTNYYKDNLDIDLAALDISKEAVRIASKRNRNVFYMVASVQDLPLFDNSLDLTINAFTPIDLNEISRTLKDNGYLLTARVGEKHLLELKEAIYDEVYLNDNKPLEDDRFSLLSSEILKFEIELNNNKEITDLFMMTPYWHHTSLNSKEKLKKLNYLKVHLEFNVDLYQKKGNLI